MTALWVAAAIVLDGAVALIGMLVPDRWLVRHRPEMLGFAAGALLAAAVLELGPEALAHQGPSTFGWVLGSMLVLALVEWGLGAHDHHAHDRELHGAMPYAVLGSDALHNFGDGMAIAGAFLSSVHLGVITSLAVIVHELPQELADYAILRAAGLARRRSLGALLGVQLTAGLGAAAVLIGVSLAGIEGIVLAVAAASFLYIATVELLPDVLRTGPLRSRIAALVGLLLGVAAIALL